MPIGELAGREGRRARRRRWLEEGVDEAPVHLYASGHRLTHGLQPLLPRWAELRGRAALRRDPEFRRHQAEVERLLFGHAWDLRRAVASQTCWPGVLRAAAWNIERGKRWAPLCGVLREHPELRELDLLLLTECDVGMGRSGNRDIPAELAAHLGMGYVFAPSHLVLAAGDPAEQSHGVANTLALHGVALLSRFPVRRVCGVSLPEYADKLHAVERRLGAKRALLAEVQTPRGALTVVNVHLDPFAPPQHRAAQMRRVLGATERFGGERILLGGDFNTNTYNLGSALGLVVSLGTKMVRYGFAGTIAHYLIPERGLERRVFEALQEHGLTVEGFIEPEVGTVRYDLNDPEVLEKTQRVLPRPVFSWLQRRLEPWQGSVPMRIDWLAGRGLRPRRAFTVDRPRFQGSHVSDHDPVGVELDWG